MGKLGLVYVKEVPMVKVKLVAKEINIKGAPMQIVIQYWTKDGKLVASGEVNKFDEPKMNNVASHNSSASVQGKKQLTVQFATYIHYFANVQNTEKQILEKCAANANICRNAIAIFLIH